MKIILSLILLLGLGFSTQGATYMLLSTTNDFAAGITNKAKAYTDAKVADSLTNSTSISTTGRVTAIQGFSQGQGTLTHAGTTTLNFDAATTDNYMSITGAVTLATSNLATNRNYSLTLYWTGITNAPLTTPAWLWQGYAPTNLWPTNKTFTILLKARGANDTNVTAVFGGQY